MPANKKIARAPHNVLVIGNGGREHTIAWALTRSSRERRVFVAPGNGGIEALEGASCVDLVASDHDAVVRFARDHDIDLTIVGPEAPLAAGLADALVQADIPCFGPSAAAARIEASKAFAKRFLQRRNVPTAPFACFTELDAALRALEESSHPLVVKASGLAGGKGAIVPSSRDEAEAAIRDMLQHDRFGAAGRELVLEQQLEGWEASLLVFTDGHRFAPMPVAVDHKRLDDGGQGPNTGGMGAFAPAPRFDDALLAHTRDRIVAPVMHGLRNDASPFVGVLYFGLMITPAGPQVLEINCRFGDPEAQVILPLLESDLGAVCLDCARGELDPATLRWSERSAVAVVAASSGYPGPCPTGREIRGLSLAAAADNVHVFHAGTRWDGAVTRTAGGRVLAVTGLGETQGEAADRAYAGLETIAFEGMRYRRDIGR